MAIAFRSDLCGVNVIVVALVLTWCLLLGSVVLDSTALAQTPAIDPPVRQTWQAVFPEEGAVRAVVTEGDVIYLLTNEGIVHALAATDGHELWRTSGWLVPETTRCPYDPPKLRSVTYAGFSPWNNVFLAVDGESIIAAMCAGWENYQTDQQLLLLDKTTGRLHGTWPVIGGLLVGVDQGVLVIADQSSVFGVSLAALREIWRTAAEQQYNPPHFEGMVDGVVLTRLYLDNQPVLTAKSIAEGTVLWEMPVGSDSYTVLGGGESVLLTRRKDGGDEEELVAMDPRTGAELWQSDLTGFSGSIYWMETVVQGGVVYVYLNAAPGRIAAVNADSGAVLWNMETPFGIRRARLFAGLIYCVGVDDERLHPQLHALDGESGLEVWAGLPGSDLLLVSSPNDLLLVTSSREGTSTSDAVVTALQTR